MGFTMQTLPHLLGHASGARFHRRRDGGHHPKRSPFDRPDFDLFRAPPRLPAKAQDIRQRKVMRAANP
jgi:hypothetical protein